MRDGTQKHEPNLFFPADFLDAVQQLVHFVTELFYAVGAIKGTGHPIAEEHDGRFKCCEFLSDALESFLRSIDVESEAGSASGRIAAPTEVAEFNIAVRIVGRERVFDVAIRLFALNKGIADESDAIALFKGERIGRVGGGGLIWRGRPEEAGNQNRKAPGQQLAIAPFCAAIGVAGRFEALASPAELRRSI